RAWTPTAKARASRLMTTRHQRARRITAGSNSSRNDDDRRALRRDPVGLLVRDAVTIDLPAADHGEDHDRRHAQRSQWRLRSGRRLVHVRRGLEGKLAD